MRTYKYKTLDGFFRNCSKHISIQSLFSGIAYHGKERKVVNVELSEAARLEAAKGFADYVFKSSTAKNILINRLMNKESDFSYLKCFHISKRAKGYEYSNSLSGEAFRYCLRMFCK